MRILCPLLAALACTAADVPPQVRVFYFGNSLTGSTAPELHTALGKSAGTTWTWDLMAVAGGQLWQYRDQFQLDAKIEKVGDYTLDPGLAAKAPYAAKKFLEGTWDAITLQPFGTTLELVQDEMWGKKYAQKRDFGDVAAAQYLIDLALQRNPAMRIFLYQDWPGALQIMQTASLGLGKSGKELNHTQMEPIRRSYDFERDLLRRWNAAEPNWGCGQEGRDYMGRLMDRLIERYPQLWAEGRLRMLPVGDIYYALDRRMRAGQVPGVTGVGEFYTDSLHHRAGMPAYIGAATFYTMFFANRLHALDWKPFNNAANYGKDYGHGRDAHNDAGVPLTITAERAQVIHDTIWDVVQRHPYTRMSAQGSREALAAYEATIPAPTPVRVLEYGFATTWSAMPAWQAGLDRSGGKASAWCTELQTAGWIQPGSAAWLDGVWDKRQHPFTGSAYGAQLEETNHDPALHHRVLCVTTGAPATQEATALASLLKRFTAIRPDGRMLAFMPWPALTGAAALRKELRLEPLATLPEERMAPLRRAFDYTAAWQMPGDQPGTKANHDALLAALSPAVRARCTPIPAGALLAALDAKLKAGALPSVGGAADFYKNDVILRTGLPRYAIAALRFAVLHQTHPKTLDATAYDDPQAYTPDAIDPSAKASPGTVTVAPAEFDNGPHLAITPQGRALVDSTIWELVGTR